MMNNNIKSFVFQKYEIITSNQNTWVRLEKYPDVVKKKWALRCARDVEYLDTTGKAKKCNDLNERYQAGETDLLDELINASDAAYCATSAYCAYNATSAYCAFRAAYTAIVAPANVDAADAADAAASSSKRKIASTKEDKWKQYIDWLVEELCEYESKQQEII